MNARQKIAAAPVGAARQPNHASAMIAGSRTARQDPRWPTIAATLVALRDSRRRSVRIVDADCGCGALLIETARYARALGFTAIEGRGIDGAPMMIGRARAAASRLGDPAIGLVFDLTDMATALREEADFPADLVLWHRRHGESDQPGIAALLAAAGARVIGDPA